jgi:hypothetical protein
MKRRAIAIVFTACLLSSLALADNPTDAPLTSNSQNTTVPAPSRADTPVRCH